MTITETVPDTSDIPFIHELVGAAADYCSDGRNGEQMVDLLYNSLGLPHYVRMAFPGRAACLAGHMLVWRAADKGDIQPSGGR